jgi:putative transposase
MTYRRVFAPGGTYFFTVVTAGRRPILTDNVGRLRDSFRHTRLRHPFEVHAVVVLPDHLHTVWKLPDGDSDFSVRWSVLKRHFSTGIRRVSQDPARRARRELDVWQRRFWERLIRSPDDWRACVDYVHFNPVKHGYCASPGDWPYSTFHRFAAAGWYPAGWSEGVDAMAGLGLQPFGE